MKENTISARLSRDIVNLLVQRGMSQSGIADLLDVTKSFISRVRAGTRNFTLNHLAILEESLGQSLPLLLIEAVPTESFSAKQRQAFESCRDLLETTGKGKQSPRRETPKKHRSTAKAA